MDTDAGGRRPRLQDVAAAAGVSTATASLVLRRMAGPSVASRDRVVAAATRLGYRRDWVASALASRRSRLIGILMDVTSPFHAQLVEDIHEVVDRSGYDVVLSTVTRSRNETQAAETLIDRRCEALLLVGPASPAETLRALGRRISTVVIARPIPPVGLDVVRVADDEGMAQAVDHLVALGHSRIEHVDGGQGDTAALRRHGYQQAMCAHRLDEQVRVTDGGPTVESGAAAARELLKGGSMPTALLTYNDDCAVGLIDTLVTAGVDVPGAVSVIGYDNIVQARLSMINLTTVDQNRPRLAQLAVAAVLERLEGGRGTFAEMIVQPELVVRGTTAPPAPHSTPDRDSPSLPGR